MLKQEFMIHDGFNYYKVVVQSLYINTSKKLVVLYAYYGEKKYKLYKEFNKPEDFLSKGFSTTFKQFILDDVSKELGGSFLSLL